MAVRLEPSDEYMHELGPESNFNESMYINCFDPRQQVGGWFRMGNRANEGYAEMTVCLYLPPERLAGRVHVQAPADRQQRRARRRRPDLDDGDAVRGAAHRLHRQGRAARRARPDGRPEGGVHQQPVRRVRGAPHLHRPGSSPACSAASPTPRTRRPGEEFAKGHYEQLVAGHRHHPGRRRGVGDRRATACATTPGARATGRRRGTTAGSPPTSARTSASWPAGSPRRTARAPAGGFVWEDGEMHLLRPRRDQHRARGRRAVPPAHRGPAALVSRSDREWTFTGEVHEPHPAAQPSPGPRRQLAA